MDVIEVLRAFLVEFEDEVRHQPGRAANRLRDRLGEAVELSGSQITALASAVSDGSLADWLDRGHIATTQAGGFDIGTVDRWARLQWSDALGHEGAAQAAALLPPPRSGQEARSITGSSGFPGEMRPMSHHRASAFGDLDYAVLPNGEVIRLLTVQATVPDPTADAFAARLPELPAGTLGVDWVERSDQRLRFGSRHASVDSLASQLDREGALSPAVALPLLHSVGRTLQECHRRGVLHGTLTAESVVLDNSGAPLLADAGLAGTLGRTVSEIADARAFAALVHRTLTGTEPPTGDLHISVSDTTPLRSVLPGAPGVTQAVEHLLAGHSPRLQPLVDALGVRPDVGHRPAPPLPRPTPPNAAPTVAAAAPPTVQATVGPTINVEAPDTVASSDAPPPPVGRPFPGPPPTIVTTPRPPSPGGGAPTSAIPQRRPALIVAMVVAAALLIGGLAWVFSTRGDSDQVTGATDVSQLTTPVTDDTQPDPTTTVAQTTTTVVATTAAPVTTLPLATNAFVPVTMAEGITVQRNWAVDGAQVVGTTAITNARAVPIALVYDEVLPKELTPTLDGVVFEPAYSEVIAPDPIVRFFQTVQSGAVFTITYRVPVTAPPDATTLAGWAVIWEQQQAAHLADPTLSPIDADVDGYVDVADVCLNEQGTLGGCLDADNDTFPDTVGDYCPGVGGALGGCPDEDGDQIIDGNDQCLGDNGQGRSDGCPDSDGDGVRNKDDDCDDKKGPSSNKGCPVPVPLNVSISGNSTVSSVSCAYTYSAVVTGVPAASYSWSSSGGVVSPSSASTTIIFDYRGATYTTSVTLTVVGQNGVSKTVSKSITVLATSGC